MPTNQEAFEYYTKEEEGRNKYNKDVSDIIGNIKKQIQDQNIGKQDNTVITELNQENNELKDEINKIINVITPISDPYSIKQLKNNTIKISDLLQIFVRIYDEQQKENVQLSDNIKNIQKKIKKADTDLTQCLSIPSTGFFSSNETERKKLIDEHLTKLKAENNILQEQNNELQNIINTTPNNNELLIKPEVGIADDPGTMTISPTSPGYSLLLSSNENINIYWKEKENNQFRIKTSSPAATTIHWLVIKNGVEWWQELQ